MQTQAASSARATHVLALLEQTHFGDIEHALLSVEIPLGLLLDATHYDFVLWETTAEAAGYPDEYAIGDEELAAMPVDLRCGWLARLLRNIALAVGIGTEYSGQLGSRRDDPHALAPFLRKLCDIAEHHHEPEVPGLEPLARALECFEAAPEERKTWYLLRAELAADALSGYIEKLLQIWQRNISSATAQLLAAVPEESAERSPSASRAERRQS